MRKRKSNFLRALEQRRDEARRERGQGQQEDASEAGASEPDAETPLMRFLLPKRKRRPYWR